MEILEYRGCKGIWAAEVTVDDNSSETGHGYVTGTVFQIAGAGKIVKTTERNSETHYYNDIPALVIQGKGADTITFNSSAIDLETLATITGNYYDPQTGMMVERDSTETKYFAIGYIVEMTDGSEKYVWRLKCTIDPPDEEADTIDNGTAGNGQTLVCHGISTQHVFTKTSSEARCVAVDMALDLIANPTAFFDSVQTPDTVTKKSQ